jgi:hypothetical protein
VFPSLSFKVLSKGTKKMGKTEAGEEKGKVTIMLGAHTLKD